MKKLLLSGFLALVSIAPVCAQVATAELNGAVLDPTGAAIANAKINAITIATNQAHQTVTSSTGTYVLTLLPPGDYRIEVEAPGFKKLQQTGVTLQINQQAEVNLTLQVGEVSQIEQVTGQAPLLETESSSIGAVVNQRLTNELPLNGRNFIQLATLSPGVNGVGFSASGTIMSGTSMFPSTPPQRAQPPRRPVSPGWTCPRPPRRPPQMLKSPKRFRSARPSLFLAEGRSFPS